MRGDYANPNDHGEVSHFQALATAVSGTVGIGNIGGVAVAVTVGGPGATFWLIMAGFLGMSTKFVECTLGVKYRNENPDGSVSGGPMYYLRKGFSDRGMDGFGKFMGTFYAVGIFIGALGIGNMFQSNQAYVQLNNVAGGGLDGYGWLVGLIMAAVVFSVIIGGIKSIARVTEKIVPFMAVFYCFFAIIVILMNFTSIPEAIGNIFSGAMTGEGVAGGAIGALIIGFQRAVFSNEAGIGSASIAHSAVRTNEPVTEGMVSLLEPFIDTIVICTITALVIGTSQVAAPGFAGDAQGIAMTSAAFERQLSWFPDPLGLCRCAVRLLHHDLVVVLRAQGMDLHVRRRGARPDHLQTAVLCLRRAWLRRSAWPDPGYFRRTGLPDLRSQHPGSVLPRPDRQAGAQLLPGKN